MMKAILLLLLLQLALTQIERAALSTADPEPFEADKIISRLKPKPPCPDCFVTQICGPFKWTNWIDCDNPSGTGDWETVANAVPLGGCPNPIWLECQTLSGINWWQTGDVIRYSTNGGCLCIDADQPLIAGVRKCRNDYRIRMLCP
jgi:hypothetical protein